MYAVRDIKWFWFNTMNEWCTIFSFNGLCFSLTHVNLVLISIQ